MPCCLHSLSSMRQHHQANFDWISKTAQYVLAHLLNHRENYNYIQAKPPAHSAHRSGGRAGLTTPQAARRRRRRATASPPPPVLQYALSFLQSFARIIPYPAIHVTAGGTTSYWTLMRKPVGASALMSETRQKYCAGAQMDVVQASSVPSWMNDAIGPRYTVSP